MEDGPVASTLRTHRPDLTTLARRNGGAFPRDRVRGFIEGTGRPLAAHGTTEMPVWGPMFRASEAPPAPSWSPPVTEDAIVLRLGCGDVCLLNNDGHQGIEGSSRPLLVNVT